MRKVLHGLLISPVRSTQHLSAADLAAFIDGTLSAQQRASAELHLSACDRCREELAACARLAANIPSASRRRGSWRFIGVAAAAVVIALLVRPNLNRDERGSSRERASSAERNHIAIIRPSADAAVRRSDLRFGWQADEHNTGYRVIVTNEKGAPVWTADVDSTRIAPPNSVVLDVGARYFWRVETLHADGSTAQSATTAFHIVPE